MSHTASKSSYHYQITEIVKVFPAKIHLKMTPPHPPHPLIVLLVAISDPGSLSKEYASKEAAKKE